MQTKIFSAYILRGSTAALLFSCVIVALCSAINLPEQPPKAPPRQDNAGFGANAHQSAASVPMSATFDNRSLSFADRVAYQRAIEDVYWRHRIWPKERPDPKPVLDAVMSQAQLEKKVQEYLRNSQALEDDLQRPLTADQLQAEMERMATRTKQPEVLREIFEALGNDPFVIAECLARQVLAQRLLTELNDRDRVKVAKVAWLTDPLQSGIATAETQAPRTVAASDSTPNALGVQVNRSYQLPEIAGPSGSCTDDTWTPTTLTNAPAGRFLHTAVWTGSEMIVWGGSPDGGPTALNTGGRYNPSTDSWTSTSTTNAPAARILHTAVWTGSEMIVWGGVRVFEDAFNTGGRYNPITNSWTATSTTNAPEGRTYHTAVWTGSQMIVWGGAGSGGDLNTGGRYDPGTDSWTATSTTNAPSARHLHTAVWAGGQMIVWGGYDTVTYFHTGGRYDPVANNWTATSITNAPTSRSRPTAVWSGSEMIVWGGSDRGGVFNTGGRYNPGADSWIATSTTNTPSARSLHTAAWSGSEMIVWGGFGGSYLDTGGRYNPSTDSWTATSTTGEPEARSSHTAVWDDIHDQMIVWGGAASGPTYLNTGGRYCAQSGSPTLTLSAKGRKVAGINTVRLTWDGATSTNIDVYRNNVLITTTTNTGTYIDSTGDTGRARYTYMVCEAGNEICSNEVTVSFQQ